jgi:hypothetical protein
MDALKAIQQKIELYMAECEGEGGVVCNPYQTLKRKPYIPVRTLLIDFICLSVVFINSEAYKKCK